MGTTTRSRAPTVVLGVIGGAIIAAVAGVLFLGGPGTVVYRPGTPEFTAQAYIQALFDGDYDAAYELLAPALRVNCRATELGADFAGRTGSAVFDRVQLRDDRATIDLRLIGATLEPGVFPIDRNEIDTRLILENSLGEWRIAEAAWPLYDCAGR